MIQMYRKFSGSTKITLHLHKPSTEYFLHSSRVRFSFNQFQLNYPMCIVYRMDVFISCRTNSYCVKRSELNAL